MGKKVEESIRQLLTVEQFNRLLGSRPSCRIQFVHTKLKKNDDIEGYLDEIGISSFSVNDFGKAFSDTFIRMQDEEWLMRFYKFLLTDSARRLIERYKLNYYESATTPQHSNILAIILEG